MVRLCSVRVVFDLCCAAELLAQVHFHLCPHVFVSFKLSRALFGSIPLSSGANYEPKLPAVLVFDSGVDHRLVDRSKLAPINGYRQRAVVQNLCSAFTIPNRSSKNVHLPFVSLWGYDPNK